MDGYSEKEEGCPQLLDLMIPHGKDWNFEMFKDSGHGFLEEKKLELRLGPPGGDWTNSEQKSHLYSCCSGERSVLKSPWSHTAIAPFLHLQTQGQFPVMKESSADLQIIERKAFSPTNKAVSNSSSAQKRTAPSQLVGWPPVRSFRKNLSNGYSSKIASDSPEPTAKLVETFPTNPLVKVNMDGVPIGRKVDLKTYDSYEKLSLAVDELFRGLLAAQRDSGARGIQNKDDRVKVILDGSGEYTLVYEDNEGDRLLVGDVPWQMFVSTVKRLRVLKSSELPILSRKKRDSDSMHQHNEQKR